MTVNANWPLMCTQVAFNSGFATLAPLSYTDLSLRMWSMGCKRGRQYELDQNQTGEAELVLADKDEVLNPANTAAGYPYAGCVLPYRPILIQAQWPPAPLGGAVNLLNSAAQAPGPYDPSFESFTAGATIPWMFPVGSTLPVVGTTTPRAGTKDATWAVANGATVQGVYWQVPCIPGQQYTSSVYVRQSSASTQLLQVTDQNLVLDQFNRTTANGWGTADLGGAWTTSGGSAADFSTAPGTASHAQTTLSAVRATVAGSALDTNVLATVTAPAVATGDLYSPGLLARWANSNNYYLGDLEFNLDRTITVRVVKTVAGVGTQLAAATLSFRYTAGTKVNLRFEVRGNALRAKAWLYGTAEPTNYNVSATDTSLTAAGAVGCRTFTGASSTNTGLVLPFSDFAAIGSVTGTTTTTTGAYVRLSVTWTATQPLHTLQLATSGTAVAGTVLIDDVQHEPGSSASTATTSGPVIYGVHAGYVERWPSNWNYKGMYGYAQITSVDAFAALAARDINAAYKAAVMLLAPDIFWSLGEAEGATAFADSSGNPGVPSLVFDESKYGAGTLPVAGVATNMAGDPGGTGVRFTAGPYVNGSFQAATMLGAGPAVSSQSAAVVLPPAVGTSWAISVAFWTQASTGFAGTSLVFIPTTVFSTVVIPGTGYLLALKLGTGPDFLYATYLSSTDSVTSSAAWGPTTWHHVAAVITQDSSTTTATLYIDGVSAGTGTTPTTVMSAQSANIYVGGEHTFQGLSVADATIRAFSLWSRALSAGEVAGLFTATGGYVGETSGARLTRYLTEGRYLGRSLVDTGQSVMGADVTTEGTALLAAAQADAVSENGNFWVDGCGTVRFTSRTSRYLSTTAKWSFGEQETPYLDDIGYDFDPQLVYNDVTVTNAGGAVPTASDAASQLTYGPRSYPRTINVEDNNEAADAATWILATHKDAHQRIASLTIDPASNPAVWPVALGVEIGDRVTVTRRTAAFTMTADYFIEQVTHSQAPGSWTVSLQMSPASLWPTPWLLDSATHSVLGSTTVLGY